MQSTQARRSRSMAGSVLLLFLGLVVSSRQGTYSLNNGLGLSPPMGWNSWNSFECDIDEELVIEMAEQMVALGLPSSGYIYFNLDDCWMAPRRSVIDERLVGHPDRFPHGMKWLGDKVHHLGLKYGIYSSAGTHTCMGAPASLGYEELDAQTFADFGVDYLKYDNCNHDNTPSIERFTTMRDALNQTGRPIFYSLCQWGEEESWKWASSVGNSWRTTFDIKAKWQSIFEKFWESFEFAPYGGSPGLAWLDPDMLEVGNGELTLDESRSHFALWCLVKAPLLLGNDLRSMTSDILEVITNQHLIDINQDPSVAMATCRRGCKGKDTTGYSIFVTAISKDDFAALIINWEDEPLSSLHSIHGQEALGIVPDPDDLVVVRDLWTKDATVVGTYDFEGLRKIRIANPIPSHGSVLYRLTINPETRPYMTSAESIQSSSWQLLLLLNLIVVSFASAAVILRQRRRHGVTRTKKRKSFETILEE